MSRLFEATRRALQNDVHGASVDAAARATTDATEQFPPERPAARAATAEPSSRSNVAPRPAREATPRGLHPVTPTVATDTLLLDSTAAAGLEYRRIATALLELQLDHPIKTVMVTSAMPGEGKTLISANLALTLSRVYHRHVLLVDADMRRPALHTLFGVANRQGFGEALQAGAIAPEALHRLDVGPTLITAGQSIADPVVYLSGPGLGQVLPKLAVQYEWVIFDTPPAELLPDASLLGRQIDACVFVVQAGRTPYPRISRALEALGREKIAGVVLNRADPDANRAAEYGASYYGDHGAWT